MVVAGLDWAGKGWFAVLHDGSKWEPAFYPTVLNFWTNNEVDRALIDVPIGLATAAPRRADAAAAAYLGSAASSVFKTPVRDAVYAESIDGAKAVHEDREVGFSVQNQAWSIVPRIRAVDAFLQHLPDGDGDRLREAHPEVAFAALSGGESLDSDKQTEAGRRERLARLGEHFEDPADFLSNVETRFMEPSYAPVVGTSARDDVVDAMALAATARSETLVRLPDEPQRDELLDREIEIVRPPES